MSVSAKRRFVLERPDGATNAKKPRVVQRTLLGDLAVVDEKQRVAIAARVCFASMPHKSRSGNDMIVLELRDGTEAEGKAVTLRVLGANKMAALASITFGACVWIEGLRCTEWQGTRSLIVGDKDYGFGIRTIDPSEHAVPEQPEVGFSLLGEQTKSTCTVMVRARSIAKDELDCEDPLGNVAVVRLKDHAKEHHFEPGKCYVLHRLYAPLNASVLLLYGNAGVEHIKHSDFEEAMAGANDYE